MEKHTSASGSAGSDGDDDFIDLNEDAA